MANKQHGKSGHSIVSKKPKKNRACWAKKMDKIDKVKREDQDEAMSTASKRCRDLKSREN